METVHVILVVSGPSVGEKKGPGGTWRAHDHALGVAELFAKEFAGTAAVLYRERHVERDTEAAAPAIVLGFPARNKVADGLGYTLLPLASVDHSTLLTPDSKGDPTGDTEVVEE